MDCAGIAETSEPGKALAGFSRAFGLAFQAADDVDDLEQDAKSEQREAALDRHRRTWEELERSVEGLEKFWKAGTSELRSLSALLAFKS
jgi:geranylgeranyl pyrophosphate synthase